MKGETAAYIVDQIYRVIEVEIEKDDGYSLLHGRLGLLVFLLYYARYKNDKDITASVESLLARYLEELPFDKLRHRYANGISGILTTLMLLDRQGLAEIELGSVNDYFKPWILSFLKAEEFRTGNYDLFYGFTGVGIYALAVNASDILNGVVETLDRTKITDDKGYKWAQPKFVEKAETDPEIIYNISMPHGMSSVVVFLSKYYAQSKDVRAAALVHGAIGYILAQEQDRSVGSMFPTTSLESQTESYPSRLAWCYGDFCPAMALWHAGKAFGNEQWRKKALEIFLFSTTRTNVPQNGVGDACLCHGAAGIAHIYRRMYFETGSEKFDAAHRYWLNETLKYSCFDNGFAGFKTRRGNTDFSNETHLLDGVSGIGLSLIASICDDPMFSSWDELLLMS